MISFTKTYNYFLVGLLLILLGYCVSKTFDKKQLYYHDFTIMDTKPNPNKEPCFLKDLEQLPEPEPMYGSDEENNCYSSKEAVVIETKNDTSQNIIKTISKKIDSLKVNNIKHVNIEIKCDLNKLSYQFFIDILDLFEKKDAKIYGVHKDVIFWINTDKKVADLK